MDRLKQLLRLIVGDGKLRDVWKEAGYSSFDEAREAIKRLIEIDDWNRPVGMSDRTQRSRVSSRPPGKKRKTGTAKRIVVYVDGASRGNPGPSAVAAVAFLPSGERLESSSRNIGKATNNVAEYKAVLEGLDLARRLGAGNVVLRLDSELVVRQLNGRYKIKNKALRGLANDVTVMAAGLSSCAFEHVPREENKEADRLANRCLDED